MTSNNGITNYLDSLRRIAQSLGPDVQTISKIVLDDPRFAIWSGSPVNKQLIGDKHHYGDGGLLKHTWEVVNLCLLNRAFYSDQLGFEISETQLFLAALFHDIGKTFDYYKEKYAIGYVWESAPHKRNIYHIQRSGLIWSKAVDQTGLFHDIHDDVYHAILAHHGQATWGSPVSPNSAVAWMLHLCDCMSARMDDLGKFVNTRA